MHAVFRGSAGQRYHLGQLGRGSDERVLHQVSLLADQFGAADHSLRNAVSGQATLQVNASSLDHVAIIFSMQAPPPNPDTLFVPAAQSRLRDTAKRRHNIMFLKKEAWARRSELLACLLLHVTARKMQILTQMIRIPHCTSCLNSCVIPCVSSLPSDP